MPADIWSIGHSLHHRWSQLASTRLQLIAFGLLLAACGNDPGMLGRSGTALEEICAEVQCRPSSIVHLPDSDTRRRVIPTYPGPYVHEGRISILEGERFRVVPMLNGPILEDLRYLGEPLSPVRAFFVQFEQQGSSMVLEFENPFSRYVAFMVSADPTSPNWNSPSRTCIIGPDQSRSSVWDSETRGLSIYDLDFLSRDAAVFVGCE